MKIETKKCSGVITEVKEQDRNGVRVGVLEGYGATWDIDRGGWDGVKDQFQRGAFAASIVDHAGRKRQVRMLNQHGKLIGGFPFASIREDERGLFVSGEVNLETQEGRETYALAKQGVMVDFSIGFSVDGQEGAMTQGDLRTIKKARIWEISTVDEPMNPHAAIMHVKTGNGFRNYHSVNDIEGWTVRDVESALREGAAFSKAAARAVISLLSAPDPENEAVIRIMTDLQSMVKHLKK